ncbi:MAG: hypothetical protein JRJ15_13705 [Deltaproteobacteria bacterium]|nr:hypothetical protein [Deltaproteobacteria bacterium]
MSKVIQVDIRDLLHQRSKKVNDPAGRELKVLEDGQATKLADECHCEVHDVYIEALTLGIYPYRYIRNREAISLREQLKLAKSRARSGNN